MNGFLLVAAGGGLGAALRHALGLAFGKAGGVYAIFAANVVGSFAMGLTMGWLAARSAEEGNAIWLFLCVGVFGGFTTFSTFSSQIVHMLENDQLARAITYVGGSVVGAVAALFAGLMIGRRVFGA